MTSPSPTSPADPPAAPLAPLAPPAPPAPPVPSTPGRLVLRTAILTALAMFAFAANSLLCRGALLPDRIDPASFTAVRLGAGAIVLIGLMRLRHRTGRNATTRSSAAAVPPPPDRLAPAMLFLYAAAFSYAYLGLSAGTGALLLFGTVQVTMFAASLRAGVHPRPLEWTGLLIAMAGLAWLVAPGLEAPDPLAAGLMAAAGVGWGVYSLRGRGAGDPTGRTAANFARSIPFGVGLLLVHALFATPHADPVGVGLAVTSGAVTSGLGYAIWYAALPGLTAVRAALVQLSVPVLTAVAALPLLGEPITSRLLLGGGLVVGGIAAAIVGRR